MPDRSEWAIDALLQLIDRLRILNRIARLANEPLPLEDLLSRITQEAVTLLRGDRGAIALMAESGDHLRVVAEYNPIGTPSGLGVTIPISGNPSMEWILRERRPLAIADVAGGPILGPMGPVLQAMGIRSLVIVPMFVGDRLIGTMGIDSVRQPRVFTEDELQLAETIAAQVAGAVERARLLEEARRRATYLEALHAILEEATKARDVKSLLEGALSHVRAVLQVPMGGIWLRGHAALQGLPEAFGPQIARVAREAGLEIMEVFAVADWAALPEGHPLRPLQALMEQFQIRSSLTVPLLHEGKRIGGLSVAAPAPRVWRPEEVALMQTVGQKLGPLVERLQLLETAQAQATRLHVLYETARALTRLQSLPALMDQAIREILEHLPADAAAVHRVDPEQPEILQLLAYHGFSPLSRLDRGRDAETITGRVAAAGIPLWVEDCAHYPYPPATRQIIMQEGFQSHAALPLRYGGELLGVLNILWRRRRAFDAETRDLLEALADLLAAGLHSAQLLERTQRQAQELEALNRALSETLRLREEMIQNVSHELRTPLTVAMGYMELLADGALGPLNPEQQEAIAVSRERLKELHRYVELLLTLQTVRAEGIARIPMDLKRLVEEILRRWRARLDPKRHILEARLPDEGVWLLGDPQGLVQAIGEILDNAVKFSPEGGKIQIALTTEGGQAVFRIRDEGIGIPPQHLARIGEPFYQVNGGTTRRFPGMGIGLTVARAVVEAHGGRLQVRPHPPRGTEVTLVLPLARPE